MLELLRTFSISQRFILLVALGGAVSLLVAVALWTQQPDMQVLFTKLSPRDATAIADRLHELKVPYEVGGGGTTILVPRDRVHDLRLKLAGDGLPIGGGVGFEIFDRSSIGMSEFVQKLNFRRAQQGELARTIAQMAEVERARVHLAVPERRLFSSEQERPRASVVLSLKGSRPLSKGQVQGIVHLVASSVEGLAPGDVTVVDGHGKLLSRVSDEGHAQLTSSQLEYQRTLEGNLEQRIQSMLERIVGPDKAVVRVSSVLDFRQVEHTEETYDPDGQVVRSEQRSQEKTNEQSGAIGGVPGVASNVPPGEAAAPSDGSANTSQVKNETLNYEISRRVSRIVEPTGTLKSLSVAVLVDGTYTPAAGTDAAAQAADQAARQYVPRTEEEMQQLEEIVKKAMGFSAERGDQVEVVNVQFDFGAAEGPGTTAEAASTPLQDYLPFVRYGLGAALFGVIFLFVVRPLLSMLLSLPDRVGAGGGPSLPASVGEVEAAIGEPPRARVLESARTDPQSTALVVKQWLKGNA